MTANAAIDIQDAITEIGSDPVVIEFDGVDYRGAVSGSRKTSKLEVFGSTDEPAFAVLINLLNQDGSEVFPTRPEIGDKFTIDGEEYRIASFELNPTATVMVATMESPDK